jgi:protein-tyrosine phosphatase
LVQLRATTRIASVNSNIQRLSVTGAYNLRDLGGYPAPGGRSVCYGRFLRSDSLHDLTSSDVDLLLDYGVRTVIDLREKEEAALEPGRLHGIPGVTVHEVPILAALAPALGGSLPANLADTYLLCTRHCTSALRTVFQLMGNAAGGAILFHCAVGKDRTGIVAALLLELAGVPREAILEDYAASGVFLKPLVERLVRQYARDPSTGVHPDFLICDPRNMERLLESLDREHGGAEAYLRTVGVPGEVLSRLRERILCTREAAGRRRHPAALPVR